MPLDAAIYEAGLAKGLRSGSASGEDKSLPTFPQALALALGVTEDKAQAALSASPALYAHAVQLSRLGWSSPTARASGLHDLGLALAGTATLDDAALMASLAKQLVTGLVPAAIRRIKTKAGGKATDVEAKAIAIESSAPTAQLATDAATSVGSVLADVKAADRFDAAIPSIASALAIANVSGFALAEANPTKLAMLCAFIAEQASLAGGGDVPIATCASLAISTAASAAAGVAAGQVTGGLGKAK